MTHTLRHIPTTLAVVAIVCGALAPAAKAGSHDADVVFEWNQIAQANIGCPTCQPFEQVRAYAMVHIAMADAVVAIEGRYEPYHAWVHASGGASADAAAAQAAHDVLNHVRPGGKEAYAEALAARLQTIPPGKRRQGVDVGKAVAEKIIAWREMDGSAGANPQPPSSTPFLLSELPGIWRQGDWSPTPYAYFGNVEPFGLLTATQFLPAPPPQLESDKYASDFDYVKNNGSNSNMDANDPQRRFALLFAGGAPGTDDYKNVTNPFRLWHNVARDIALQDKLSLAETARLFALLTASIHDSLQTSHTSKFVYRLWRPIAAVRNASIDNNDATGEDMSWTPLLSTPPYPSHASNMSCIGTGSARMLKNVLGTDAKSFTARWYKNNVNPMEYYEQHYTSLWALAQDQGNSRVWGGIHFRFEIDASEVACTQVADYLFDNFMPPRKGH